jgi:hypothetical protein
VELAFAIKEAQGRSAVKAARQVLFLIALTLCTGYIVPACMNFVSRQATDEARAIAQTQDSDLELNTGLVCSSTLPQFWERLMCKLQN